jgi:precorrin-8X/cobalt-precorrin-8 methylmutase
VTQAAPLFDAYLMVDWSAANTPKRGEDSIWISLLRRSGTGFEAEAPENPATRREAYQRLRRHLHALMAEARSVLLGFDFSLGYARNFASRLRLDGPPWRAIWDELARSLRDNERNESNRFAVAASLNQRVSGGAFPFWGAPPACVGQFLAATHHRQHDGFDIAERRLVELRTPGAQSTWKLLGVGSVGSQALTGIPIVRRLRDDPLIAPYAAVWPFETGLRPLGDDFYRPRVVFAEVYPSLIDSTPEKDEVRDAAQVRSLARHFAELDARGELAELFAGDPELSAAERTAVEQEEGWVLGVRGNQPSPSRRKRGGPLPLPQAGEGLRSVVPSERNNELSAGAGSPLSRLRERDGVRAYDYLRDPAAIYRRSFEMIRGEVDLSPFPPELHALALRLVHAVADPSIFDDLRWSSDAAAAGRAALAKGAPILADAAMVAHGITRSRLPQANEIICTLSDPSIPEHAAALETTRSAAAVELWRAHLAGAVVAIGNAPTALFHLLEMIASGAPRPALILGFAVGFVGAAEAKAALVENTLGLPYVALAGRRGGSAMAAAAVNALASEDEGG